MGRWVSRIRTFFSITLPFFLKTGITETTLRKMFCRICELDYNDPVDFFWFSMMAYGNSISIRYDDGNTIVLNEADLGVRVSSQRGQLWAIEYETSRYIGSLDWFDNFKAVYVALEENNIFEIRQKENLLKSSQGVVN